MLMDSLRDALRSLRRAPGFALLTVAILAVGVGLNTAIFTVVDCVLLRPLGYHDADRIVAINTRFLLENRSIPRLGGDDYVDLSEQVHGLAAAAYYNNWNGAVEVLGHSAMVPLAYVSPRFGQVLGVEPVAGRLFNPTDTKGTDALVSATFAREHFGTVDAAVGQPVHGEGGLYTIVGVLPDGFAFPATTAVWFEWNAIPLGRSRTSYSNNVIAKRRADVSEAQLNAELATFSKHLQQAFVEDRYKALEATSLQTRVVGRIAPTLKLLLAAVAVILLIVCANVTHLQLVRATRRAQEVTVRSALGASRARLALRALLEAALLSVAGGAGAVLLAWPALRLLVHLAPAGLPRLAEISLNAHVLLWSLLVSLLVMAATALLPLWRMWHVEEAAVLRHDSTRGMESRAAVRLRGAFLVAQVAFTLVLTAAAVLLARQLVAQSREDLGFNLQHLYTIDANIVDPAAAAWQAGTPEQRRAEEQAAGRRYVQHLNAALETLRTAPGVARAEAMHGAPLGFDGPSISYAIQGKGVFAPPYKGLPSAELRLVTPGALSLLQVPLLRGRAPSESDIVQSPHIVLINRSLAEQQFHGEDPVGKRIACGYDDDAVTWWTIVGVIGDVKETPGSPASATFYVPIAQHPTVASSMQLLVRTAPGAQLSEEALRRQLQRAQPDMAVTATSMEHNLSEVERDLRFKTVLFESFAGVSILLAMLGMYGATAYSVSQRTFEFGLRMALGSTREQVVLNVMRRALSLALAGTAAGLLLYVLLLRLSASLVGTLPSDPLSLLIASLGITVLTLAASAIPARHASTVDPARALRTS